MKKLIYNAIVFAMLSGIMVSCKKKKESEPAPTTVASVPNRTVEIAIVDYASGSMVVTNPKVIAVYTYPAGTLGDTISVNTVTSWSMATSPSIDSTAFALYGNSISTTVSYPLASDGSYYMLYIYEGTTVLQTLRIYANNIVAGAGPGTTPGVNIVGAQYRYSPPLVICGW